MAFNPDEYISKKSKGFNPDAYLSEKMGNRMPASVSSATDSTSEQPSVGESLLRGAAQGATLGFADELAGGGEALLNKLSGQDNGKSLLDLYRQHRGESRAAYETAEKANPIASLVGGIGGGIVPGILSGGVGEVAQAPGILSKLGSAAKLGAGAGAAMGLGGSTADITQGDVAGSLKDIAGGTAMGAATGAALQGLGSTAKGLMGLGNKTRLGQDLGTSYQMGKEGTNLLSHNVVRNIEGPERLEAAKNITSELLGLKGVLGKQFDDITKKFGDGKIDLKETTDSIQKLINNLNDKVPTEAADKIKLQTLLDNFTKGKAQATSFTPATIENVPAVPSSKELLQQKLAKLNAANKFEGGSSSLGNVVEGAPVGAEPYHIADIPGEGGKNYLGIFNKDKGLSGIPTEDIPGIPAQTKLNPAIPGKEYTAGTYPINEQSYSETMALKRGLRDYGAYGSEMASQGGTNVAGQATGIVGKTLEEQVPGSEAANEAYHGLMEDVFNKLGIKQDIKSGNIDKVQDKLSRLLFNAESDTAIGANTQNKLTPALEALSNINPETAQNVKDIQQRASQRIRIARMANNEAFPTAGNPLETAKGLVGIKGANIVGRASKVLVDMPKESLTNMGTQLMASQTPLAPQLGKILVQAAEKDQIGRNALIFTLMQNPDYRQLLNGTLGLQTEQGK